MKTNLSIFFAALAIYLSTWLAEAQGNLIANGSFENTNAPYPGYYGWAVGGNGFSSGNSGQFGSTAPDGNHFAYFNGYAATVPPYTYGILDTYVGTTIGAYYLLTFSAIALDGTNSASVNLNGSLFATLNFISTVPVNTTPQIPPPTYYNTNWQSFSYLFQATSQLTEITFKYSAQGVAIPDPPGADLFYGAGGFDNISLVQVVPEPSTVALLGASLAGVLARRCFGRKRL
jgi:hypothetical protein